MAKQRWFYYSAGSLSCYVRAGSLDEAAEIGTSACKAAYRADTGHYYQCGDSSAPPSRLTERDEVDQRVRWAK
jgi:hypothetical protein